MGMGQPMPYGSQKPMDSGPVACHVIQAVTEAQRSEHSPIGRHKEREDHGSCRGDE
jgi:hypothetical protein